MKFDERIQKISEKAQSKKDRIGIILGVSLLIACGLSYFVLDAFGEQEFVIDCPKNAYHGLDNQGNDACRDILTNQVLEPESITTIDSNSEKTNSGVNILQETEKIALDGEQFPILETIGFFLIGILGSGVIISAKKGKFQVFQRLDLNIQRHGWTSTQKEQVKDRQYGKCNMCFTPPTKWKYNHIDGNKNNNDLNNCQGLCPNCLSVKTERDNRNIYQ
ncbi:MAG: hypothetical protein ACE5DT_05640 [Nitrosopumilus sp.]